MVQRLQAYVPGEQPRVAGLIKLNTNESPYPPSPKVLAAVRRAVDSRLRLYPDPVCMELRKAIAERHGCGVSQVVVGNGSDDLLALATRAFVEPSAGGGGGRSVVQFFSPCYSLYPVLAATHGAVVNEVRLGAGYGLPVKGGKVMAEGWERDAALTFVTTPNAPSGRGYGFEELRAVCASHRGVVILDEAYVDFAEEEAIDLAWEFPNVLVARTFSKGYSLCFQRVGYMVGDPVLIEAIDKVRDSYNVNGLGQVAALATLRDPVYYERCHERICGTREWFSDGLRGVGFEVLPSQANFILVRPPTGTAAGWLGALKERKILVRWFDRPGLRDWLRVTIGSEAQMKRVLGVVRGLLVRGGGV